MNGGDNAMLRAGFVDQIHGAATCIKFVGSSEFVLPNRCIRVEIVVIVEKTKIFSSGRTQAFVASCARMRLLNGQYANRGMTFEWTKRVLP
jgi:hypothetical protein